MKSKKSKKKKERWKCPLRAGFQSFFTKKPSIDEIQLKFWPMSLVLWKRTNYQNFFFSFLFLQKMEISVKKCMSKSPAGWQTGCFGHNGASCRNVQRGGKLDV